MKPIRCLSLVALACVPLLAYAHTHLESSVPADKSVLAEPPSSITLQFSEATRLTALTLQPGEGKDEQKLGPLPSEASAQIEIPAPRLGSGSYTLKWRAIGEDNHVMTGSIRFTVSAEGKSASAPSRPQDLHAR